MKMFIVQEEKEYKIFRVDQDQINAFQKEHGNKVVSEASNLGDLINKFQELNLERMHFDPGIKTVQKKEEETRLKRSQKL